jgi:hypothetical protein
MHSVSLTLHALWNFRTSKSENHMQNCNAMQKKIKMHAVSMTPHARCMQGHWHRRHDRRTIRTALASFKGNIYQKHICSRIVLPHSKKYINLNWLPNKKFSCMRCQWLCKHDFCVRKSSISRRIRSRIQKGFRPWISGPEGHFLHSNLHIW